MEKQKIRLNDIEKRDPFKTPDGYFEQFAEDFMSRLPGIQPEPVKVVSLWEKVRPWIYMAAMFVGISLIVNLFTSTGNVGADYASSYSTKGFKLSSDADIEDYYDYYEEGMAEVYFDDVLAGLSE
jgi:hypothetical protein